MAINRIPIKSDGGEIVRGKAHHIECDEARQLAEYYLITNDLQFAGAATKRLIAFRGSGEEDIILPRCLWTGAIEAYARCFAEGRRFRLNREKVFEGAEVSLKSHEYLITLRNQYTAHPVRGLELAKAGVWIDSSGNWKVETIGSISDAPPSDVVTELGRISEEAWTWVKQERMKVQEELLAKAKNLGEEVVTSYPKTEVVGESW